MRDQTLHLIGYAYGDAGADPHVAEGPIVLKQSQLLHSANINYQWMAMLTESSYKTRDQLLKAIHTICEKLAKDVSKLVQQKKSFVVLGGDHTSAIGVWSGLYDALHEKGDIGLLWIDAHMDSHTPETTLSGRIHGMPLAVLLGSGYPDLVNILHSTAKLKPQNLCLVGIRSFESGEAEFLRQHNVRIFYMDEITERGFAAVMQDAIEHVSQYTVGFGISLDLDGLDPEDAPGVAVPEDDGIRAKDLWAGLTLALQHPKYVTTEIVEFDPARDINQKTEKLVVSLLELFNGHKHSESH